MKAAVLEGRNQFVVKQVDKPSCPPHGLLLKVEACGLCGSDIRKIRNGSSKFTYPIQLGHEVAGIVVEADENPKGYKVSDRLAVGSAIPCGECFFCKKGLDNLCAHSILHALGETTDPVYNGGYAEYMPMSEKLVSTGPVVRIPDNVSYKEACLAEPYTDVLNSHELIKISPGDTAVVIGAGPIGAMHVELLKLKGVQTTILADILERRLELAKVAVSPDILVNSKTQSLKDIVMDATNGRGADLVIVACASAKIQQESLELVRKGGDIILFSGLKEVERMIELDSNLLHYSQISIHGTFGAAPRHFDEIMELIKDKKIKPSCYITEMLLDEIQEAIVLAEKGEVLKAVLLPE